MPERKNDDAPDDWRGSGIDGDRERDPRSSTSTRNSPRERKPASDDPRGDAPGESIEGEGSPGLSITGGGGHA
jgi:hypothetical protein